MQQFYQIGPALRRTRLMGMAVVSLSPAAGAA